MTVCKATRMPAVIALVFLSAAGLGGSGCAPLWDSGKNSPSVSVADIEVVLIAPFDSLSPRHAASSNRCPICSAVLTAGRVQSGAADYMTGQLMNHVRAGTDYTLMGPGTAAGIRAQIISANVGISRRALLLEMGRAIGADAVVSGIVYRFRQREGTNLAIQTPASVGFGVHFIRCTDGRLIWSEHFDETQRDLSENLFELPSFVRRGGRWLTAEQLAAYGLSEIMNEFPVPSVSSEND